MTISVRPMNTADLDAADHVCRVAFGTYLGVPDPPSFFGERHFIKPRWLANTAGAIVAEAAGEVIGSNIVTQWGRVTFFGPLTVRPDHWGSGAARLLLKKTMEIMDKGGAHLAGLFTFADSVKHAALYQRFGYWPRSLVSVMTTPIAAEAGNSGVELLSSAPEAQLRIVLKECREVADGVFPGLDLTGEILAVLDHRLGDIVILRENGAVVGFAVCHHGPGTEGGADRCFVKFAAVSPGPSARHRFASLLDGCERHAASAGLAHLEAGVNMAREDACRAMMSRGYRVILQGIAMHRHNTPGYDRHDVHAIDDWR